MKTRHFRQLARKHGENFGKKREDWTVPALLTRFFYETLFHPGFVPVSKRGLHSVIYHAIMLPEIESRIFRAGCDSLPVVQPTSRKA